MEEEAKAKKPRGRRPQESRGGARRRVQKQAMKPWVKRNPERRKPRKKAEGEEEPPPLFMGGAEHRTTPPDDEEPEIKPFFEGDFGDFDIDAPNDRFIDGRNLPSNRTASRWSRKGSN